MEAEETLLQPSSSWLHPCHWGMSVESQTGRSIDLLRPLPGRGVLGQELGCGTHSGTQIMCASSFCSLDAFMPSAST